MTKRELLLHLHGELHLHHLMPSFFDIFIVPSFFFIIFPMMHAPPHS